MSLAAIALPDLAAIDARGWWEPSAYDASLAALRAAGLSCFELARTRRITAETAAAIRDRAERLGLRATALHAPALHGPEVLERQRTIAAAACSLGAEVLVCHVSSRRFARGDPAGRERVREADWQLVQCLGQVAGEHGLKLALENGSHPLHPAYVQGLVEAVGLPNVGIALDTGHANLRGQTPSAVAAALGPFVLHVHAHDNHGRRDEHLPPGHGSIPWPRLVAELRAAGYWGVWCLELQECPPGDLARALIEGRRFLEPLLTG